MKKYRIFVDMDGVISNFEKAADEGNYTSRPDLYVDYRNLEVIPGAKNAMSYLNDNHDVFIASTPRSSGQFKL